MRFSTPQLRNSLWSQPFRVHRWHFIFFAIGFASLTPAAANSDEVVIRVLNVASAEGRIRVALCLESEWKTHQCSYGRQVPAASGIVEVRLQVPPGRYGVLVHHDLNGDGEINKNLIGIPVEGVGFSRDAPIRFGFPPFAAVSLSVGVDSAVAEVSLIFEPRRPKP